MARAHFNESRKCYPRAEDRTFSRTCRLREQGQGLQNVSARPRMSPRTLPLLRSFIPTIFHVKQQEEKLGKPILNLLASTNYKPSLR